MSVLKVWEVSPLFAHSLPSLCLKRTTGFGSEAPKVVPIIYKGGLISKTALKARYFIVGKNRLILCRKQHPYSLINASAALIRCARSQLENLAVCHINTTFLWY